MRTLEKSISLDAASLSHFAQEKGLPSHKWQRCEHGVVDARLWPRRSRINPTSAGERARAALPCLRCRLAVFNSALRANAVRGRSGEVKIALVLHELRDGDVLDRDRIVGIGGDHRVAAAIIVCGGQQLLEIGKDGVIDFDHVRAGAEIGEGDIAEIRGENERVAGAARRRGRHGGCLSRRAG